MRRIVALACALSLAGCAGMPAKPETKPHVDVASAEAAQRARADALGLARGDCAAPGWALVGRVALSNGKDGGSARIEWTQGNGDLHLQLSAPVTRQNWMLDVDAGGATLQGVLDGPRHGSDASALLRDATGWDIPVAALGCWLRAVAADPARFGDVRVGFAADGAPVRIEQGGWVVDYSGWKPDPVSRLPMPSRINAQRGDSRVRLVVDRWGLE